MAVRSTGRSTSASSTLTFSGGPTVDNAAGTGPGTINDTGVGTTLYFDNTQTFNKATINLGNVSYYDYLYSDDVSGAGGQVLTLASGVTIDVQGYAEIEGGQLFRRRHRQQGRHQRSRTGDLLIFAGNSLTNSGTIAGASSGGALTIEVTTFTNQGALAISNGNSLTVASTSFNNTGTISVNGTSGLAVRRQFDRRATRDCRCGVRGAARLCRHAQQCRRDVCHRRRRSWSEARLTAVRSSAR